MRSSRWTEKAAALNSTKQLTRRGPPCSIQKWVCNVHQRTRHCMSAVPAPAKHFWCEWALNGSKYIHSLHWLYSLQSWSNNPSLTATEGILKVPVDVMRSFFLFNVVIFVVVGCSNHSDSKVRKKQLTNTNSFSLLKVVEAHCECLNFLSARQHSL